MIIKLLALLSIEGAEGWPKHGGPLPSAAGSGWSQARRVSNGIPRLTSSHGAAWVYT